MPLYKWEVRASINDVKETTATTATSKKEAKSHMFSPEQKAKLQKAGVKIITKKDVEKLCFKNVGEVEPKKEKSFWWQEN